MSLATPGEGGGGGGGGGGVEVDLGVHHAMVECIPDLCHSCASWTAISRPSPLLPPVIIQNVGISKRAMLRYTRRL